VRTEAQEVLGAERHAVEVLDFEEQRMLILEIVQQDVLLDPRLEPLQKEIPDVEIDGGTARRRRAADLLDLRAGRGRSEQ